MGILKFDNLPVNTLVGADRKTFDSLCANALIDDGYRGKFKTTKCIERLLSPFYSLNERAWENLPEVKMEAPVFILGHWRSGTTFAHNVFSCDKRFGTCTTYQTVFPHLMLRGQGFFKACVSFFMPSNRPTDSLELKVDQPQEEEFALVNMMPYSFYNFWFFPKNFSEYRDKYLLFDNIGEDERNLFKENLDKLIKTSLHCQKKSIFLSKNPPHTGRIKALLEMYPDAKFIYLVRNPYTVFESTRSFFNNTIKSLQLQDISPEEMEDQILVTYSKLFHKYEQEKSLIPQGNLVEIKFEDFEASPLDVTAEVYGKLSLGGFEDARADMEKYLSAHKGFRKNKYKYSDRTISVVEENWGEAIEKWGYDMAGKI